MKKILLLIDALGPGGAQRQIVGLAKLLKQRGYDVELIDYWDIPFYDEYLKKEGIEFEHCVQAGKFKILERIRKEIKKRNPDVVIAYMERPSIIAILSKLSTRKKFKLIVSERNTTQVNTLSDKIRFNLFRFADYVVPNSYSQKKFINENYKFLSDKIKVITNFLDTEKFKPRANGAVRNADERRILVVGRIVEQKNPLRFLKAVAEVRKRNPESKFRIDWFGTPYPEIFYKECLDLKTALGLDDHIFFHSSKNDIVSEYLNSDAFMLPSIYEGFPNVLCEAMSCGLPVAAGAVCDNPHILGHGDWGLLFDPTSVDEMSDALEYFVKADRDTLDRMGEKSREVVLRDFSAEQFVERYIELIES